MTQRLFPDDHPDVATSLNNLAFLYVSQGRYSEAEPLYQQALAMYQRLFPDDHPDVATSLNNLAFLYSSQGRYSEAVTFLKQGTDVEEALLSRNLVTGSEQQKRAYLAIFRGTTDATISLHLEDIPNNQDAANLALTTILRRKGRVLDVLSSSLRQLRENLTPETQQLFDELAQVQTQLSQVAYATDNATPSQIQATRQTLADLKEKAQTLEAQLINSSAEFRTEIAAVAISQVQDKIPDDAALLEFIQYNTYNAKTNEWGSPRYAVYILPSSGEVQFADLGEADAINQEIDQLRKALQSQQPLRDRGLGAVAGTSSDAHSPAKALYTQLLEPILGAISDAEHLLIAPDSQLNLIPFAALVDPNERYLLEDYRITYLTSGRDLLRLQLRPEEVDSPLLLANPTYDRSTPVSDNIDASDESGNPDRGNQRSSALSDLTFGPLPKTAEEGSAIAQLIPEFQLYTEEQANENRLKDVQSPRFLHIATHGFFLPPEEEPESQPQLGGQLGSERGQPLTIENPLLRSGLALAGFNTRESGEEDGVLTALEVTGLRLRGTELVVLSACETGVGDVVQGEGVYGLRRAFTLAGAQTQLMSLWKVADKETKDLMIEYYQRLENGEGRGEALRQVQLAMLADSETEHPFFWAAFIPTGDWRPLD
ncbi:UNVERIFIED_CONTAM: hypothetical protein BEN50_11580 [Euhalothece sp. KZN 001]